MELKSISAKLLQWLYLKLKKHQNCRS